jgi:hypothetical protein
MIEMVVLALGRKFARAGLAALALAAVSCVDLARLPPPSSSRRLLPSERTPRPVVGLSVKRGVVHVTTASWIPSAELFGRFEDPRDAVASLKGRTLTLVGPGAITPPAATSPRDAPVGPWCDADVRSGRVENDVFALSWVSHGPVRSKLRFKTAHGALSATYADVAYRRGGATPERFLLAGGIAVRNKSTETTSHFVRGRGPASVERAIADAKDLVATTRKFPSNRVSSVWMARTDAWVGTFDAGLCRVNLATGNVTRPRGSEGMPKDISTLLKMGDLVFAGSYHLGLWVLDVDAGVSRRVDGVLGRRVNCLLLHGDILWVGTDEGVSVVNTALLPRLAEKARPRSQR